MSKKGSDIFCNCLYSVAHELARLMTEMAEEEFRPTGLSPSHAFLLMLVNETPGINPLELSSRLNLKPSTITRFADKLVYKSLLERQFMGKNVLLYPTDKGRLMQDEIKSCWNNLYQRYINKIGKERADTITSDINDLNNLLKM